MQTRIPVDYVLRMMPPTWADLRFGLERGFISEADVVEAAVKVVSEKLNPSSVEIELAGLLRKEVSHVPLLLTALVASSETTEDTTRRRWLYLVLAWLYDRRESLDDPLGMVEEVYADFGYPEEIAGFVRYMPPRDGYRPQDHTREENIDRLFRLWSEYLAVSCASPASLCNRTDGERFPAE
jgi:hypothetical protein